MMETIFKIVNADTGEEMGISDVDSPTGIITKPAVKPPPLGVGSVKFEERGFLLTWRQCVRS